MLGAQLGRDVMYKSPQTSSAVQGLGTQLALEIQKFMPKGALLVSSSLCTSFPAAVVLSLTLSLEEGKG